MLKGERRGAPALGPCSIRGRIDGQKAREMQAWWLTQPGGNEKVSKVWDSVSTIDDFWSDLKCAIVQSPSAECFLIVHHMC